MEKFTFNERRLDRMTKRFVFDWKSGRMKDTQSNSLATSDMRILETQINDACNVYENKIKKLVEENQELNRFIEELKQTYEEKLKKDTEPNCHKCIEYANDNVGDYCMSENGLLDGAWSMFPFEWDYSNAKKCSEYEDGR